MPAGMPYEREKNIMSVINRSEVEPLIVITLKEYLNFLRINSSYVREFAKDFSELHGILNESGFFNRLFNSPQGLSAEGYIYLLEMCYKLADTYGLSTRSYLDSLLSRVRQGQQIKTKVRYLQNCEPPASIWQAGEKTVKEKLISQVKKFGNEKLAERISALENGQSRIVFMEMKDGTEGQTVLDNGKITYRLSKKYEKATDKADLWRASIILAHELQRNPSTGDLRSETTEIVLKDVEFIECLVAEYGERVYEKIPEFAVFRDAKKIFDEKRFKEFVDIVFNHSGSYWRLNTGGGVNLWLIELRFRILIIGGRLKGFNTAADNLEHFLNASGATRYFDASWLMGFSAVQFGVRQNKERFEQYFLRRASTMSEGETVYIDAFPREGRTAFGPFGDLGFHSRVSPGGSELYLHYAFGTFTISTFCNVTITTKDEMVYIVGTLMHIFWDIYDWHVGFGVRVPIFGNISDADGQALVDAGRAAIFNMQSSWTEGINWTF